LLAQPDPPPVRLLVRSRQKVERLIASDDALACLARAELVIGDFRDQALLAEATAGVGSVIHNLHSHEYWKGTDHILDVNVEGARGLAEEVMRAAVGQVIYIGSYSVHFQNDGPRAEDLRGRSSRAASSQAKYVVQKILEAASENGERFRLDVVSPSYMMGPWQLDPTYFGSLFHVVQLCRLKWAPPGGINLVDVRDVAAAVVGCLTQPTAQRILATGDNLSFDQMFAQMNGAGGRPFTPRLIPAGLLRNILRLRFFGKFGRHYFDRPHWVERPSEITRRFTVEQTLADTVRYAAENRLYTSRWHVIRSLAKRYV
jgi:dihydroflavonol-4-reductase